MLLRCCIFALLLIEPTFAFPQKPTLEDLIKVFNTDETIKAIPNEAPVNVKQNSTLSLDKLIQSIIESSPDESSTKSKAYKSCGERRECVPLYLCKDDSIVTDGTDFLDVRFGATESLNENNTSSITLNTTECGSFEICCSIISDKNSIDTTTTAMPLAEAAKENVGCGFRNFDKFASRILGVNNDVEFGEYPWMVAIFIEKLDSEETQNVTHFVCGGSLLAPNVILTAAHCITKFEANTLIARAGEWNIATNDEIYPHQDRQIHKIIIHEHFHKLALHNDIALLITDKPFEYQENIRPICLPPPDANFDGSRCYATGWGKDKFGNDGNYQGVLKKIDLSVVPSSQCQRNLRKTRLGSFFQLHESYICAGGEPGKDTCKGDGGSPLVCPIEGRENQFYQAGIVAWGIGCGEDHVPGVYASVAHSRSWIDENLSKLNVDFSHFTA